MKLQAIHDIIQTDAVAELRVEQGDQVTPRAEGASLRLDPGLACQMRDQMVGNQVAKLA